MKPRLGIPVPTSRDFAYNQRSWPQYAAAIQQAGGEPVRLELGNRTALRAAATRCEGFLLPGSPADVLPERYGQATDPLTSAADPAREECDDLLLDEAERSGRPVLGICFGLQSINVWKGGSLVQHVLPMPINHAAGPEVAIAHAALIARKSLLGSLVDGSEAALEGEFFRLPINTSHHQAVAIPGEGLRIVARAPDDGVVEALEAVGVERFLLGVQWHPERSVTISGTSRALFSRLVAEAHAWSLNHAEVAQG